MPVTYETCRCGLRFTIPGSWTVFRCATCGQTYERGGGIWFPKLSRRKVSSEPIEIVDCGAKA